jgi:hypothetical protein
VLLMGVGVAPAAALVGVAAGVVVVGGVRRHDDRLGAGIVKVGMKLWERNVRRLGGDENTNHIPGNSFQTARA